jgi:hypothetical protein
MSMTLPIVVVFDHSGHFYATLQRRMRQESFDVFFYYQNLKYLDEIEQLKPDLIAIGRQLGFPQNHREVLQGLRSRPSLKHVPVILSLVVPLEEPDAQRLGVKTVAIEPSLENLESLIAAMHEILGS